MEELDAIVARVGDDELPRAGYARGGRSRKPELAGAVALRAEREGMGAV